MPGMPPIPFVGSFDSVYLSTVTGPQNVRSGGYLSGYESPEGAQSPGSDRSGEEKTRQENEQPGFFVQK